jgi:hypothetical protein
MKTKFIFLGAALLAGQMVFADAKSVDCVAQLNSQKAPMVFSAQDGLVFYSATIAGVEFTVTDWGNGVMSGDIGIEDPKEVVGNTFQRYTTAQLNLVHGDDSYTILCK